VLVVVWAEAVVNVPIAVQIKAVVSWSSFIIFIC
jgi:hypothetical protein